ncbi:MAG: OsmC family protein [Candidatus Eisenbacteria bacterium]|uniref:OsmC family protein n=1 Tax=Eiseniibacteriota bacterium TaxID=2212470 RepID=A0A9D6L4M9_UNCEI|nr:OsmC family protein [Candidatus Eisenbacteria bacterium]MBI3538691.1 OsmC family protein [Candidatus Eisenbacteria bacterium]
MANTATVTLRTVAGEGLVFEGRVPGGEPIVMDSGETPAGPSPVEMLLIALGGCAGMDVIAILRKKRQVVLFYEVVLTGERKPDHPRRFTRIEVVHRVRGHDLKPAAIEEAIRLSDTKYCSVHATIAPDVEIVSRYEIIPA